MNKTRTGSKSAAKTLENDSDDPIDVSESELFDEFDDVHAAAGRDSALWEPPSPDDAVFQRELGEALDRALGTLDAHEELWIRLYYGVPYADRRQARYRPKRSTVANPWQKHRSIRISSPKTLQEIADQFEYAPETVRRTIADGLRKLRHDSRNLRPVLYPGQERSKKVLPAPWPNWIKFSPAPKRKGSRGRFRK